MYTLKLDSVPGIGTQIHHTADTRVLVHFPLPVRRLDDLFAVRWIVRASDGRDSTAASNNKGRFYLDIR
jgi:hypothetical protein